MTSDVLADVEQDAVAIEQRGGMQAAPALEHRLGAAQRRGKRMDHVRSHGEAVGEGKARYLR